MKLKAEEAYRVIYSILQSAFIIHGVWQGTDGWV